MIRTNKDETMQYIKDSVVLGFNVANRCHYCGKPAVTIDKRGYYICRDCETNFRIGYGVSEN